MEASQLNHGRNSGSWVIVHIYSFHLSSLSAFIYSLHFHSEEFRTIYRLHRQSFFFT